MKIAVVHEWLSVYGGSEKVTETIINILPECDVYALVYDEQAMPESFKQYNVKTTFIQNLPFSKKYYKMYLPIMPHAFESLDLSMYDMVISSSTACAKGVITRPDAIHICYCHTPMRYAWDFYHQYVSKKSQASKVIIGALMHRMRIWDYAASSRVDYFISNSNYIAKRILKFYRREATTIYPPVEVERFYNNAAEGFYLIVSRLVSYKRVDIAVDAFSKSGKKLIIIGDGPEKNKLKKVARENIMFLGRLNDDEIAEYYSKCNAFIFPGEEDFGITPVEAQASGKPVIAFGKGGALETVLNHRTGILFSEQNEGSLNKAIDAFEKNGVEYNSHEIQEHAESFSKKTFISEFEKFLNDKIKGEQI